MHEEPDHSRGTRLKMCWARLQRISRHSRCFGTEYTACTITQQRRQSDRAETATCLAEEPTTGAILWKMRHWNVCVLALSLRHIVIETNGSGLQISIFAALR